MSESVNLSRSIASLALEIIPEVSDELRMSPPLRNWKLDQRAFARELDPPVLGLTTVKSLTLGRWSDTWRLQGEIHQVTRNAMGIYQNLLG